MMSEKRDYVTKLAWIEPVRQPCPDCGEVHFPPDDRIYLADLASGKCVLGIRLEGERIVFDRRGLYRITIDIVS